MDYVVLLQFFSHRLIWPFVIIAVVALAIWLLSWFFFPDPAPQNIGRTLQNLDGLDLKMAKRLKRFGIYSDRDLIRLSARGQQELESQLGLHNGEFHTWRRQILARWRDSYLPEELRNSQLIYPDPELGGRYAKAPSFRDDLTTLDGIDAANAKRINEVGIYTFEQLRLLTPEQQANLKHRFSLAGFDFNQVPAHGVTAKALAAHIAAQGDGDARPTTTKTFLAEAVEQSSEAVSETSGEQSGNGSPIAPAHAEQRDTGMDAKPEVSAVDSTPAEPRDANVGQALNPQRQEPTTSSQVSRDTIPKSVMDPEFGRVYTAPPPHRDDLSKLEGVNLESADELNQKGIYTVDQLLSLSPSQQDKLVQRFDLPHANFRSWRHRYTAPAATNFLDPEPTEALDTEEPPRFDDEASGNEWENDARTATQIDTSNNPNSQEQHPEPEPPLPREHIESQPVPSSTTMEEHPELGRVFINAPEKVDDLTRLKGIDAERQQRLNALGIYTFEQLMSLGTKGQPALAREADMADLDMVDWCRCIHAWSRGVETVAEVDCPHRVGTLHGVRLPEVASGIFDGEKLVTHPEQVVFRGTNPEAWGTMVLAATDDVERSLAAGSVHTNINYVRVRRVDTGESVVASITKGQLFSNGPEGQTSGWNGSCEEFHGARHLGIYSRDIPQEVETRFGMGGWGFGHRFHHNDQQEWAWAGRLIPQTPFEISVGHIGSPSGTVVFRSSEPTLWNTRTRNGKNHFALPLDAVTHPVSYLRLLRTDTGEAIIIRIRREQLLAQSDNPRLGWNGSNEHFLGGHHLGVYHRDAPQRVEVAYAEGGWGFGHPYGDNNRQAWGWGGHDIGGPTVFEVSLLEFLPDYLQHELLE